MTLADIGRWIGGIRLSRQLTILAAVTSVTAGIVPCLMIGAWDWMERRQALFDTSHMMVAGLQNESAAPLTFDDAAAAQEALDGLMATDERVTRATVLRRDGTVLAARRAAGASSESLPMPRSADTQAAVGTSDELGSSSLLVRRLVTVGGDTVGAVVVEFSLASYNAHFARLWLLLGSTPVTALVVAWFIGGRLQRFVSDPIVRLATLAHDVSRQQDYSLRGVHDSDDEIGALVDGVNEMLERIQVRDAALADQHRTLEAAVESRTAELEASAARFRALVESTRAIPWEAGGTSFALTYISPGIRALLPDGTSLTGSAAYWDCVHDSDRERVMAHLAHLAAQPAGFSNDIEYRLNGKNAQVFDVRSATGVNVNAAGQVVLRGMTFDVTEHKRMGRELQQAQKLESVGRLASGVAHEINTPIQFVSDSVHFVKEAFTDVGRVVHAYRGALASVNTGTPAAQAVETTAAAENDADLDYLLENVPQALERALDGLSRVAVIVRSMKDFAHPDQIAMAPVDLNRGIESTLVIANNEFKYVADLVLELGALPMVACHGGEVNQVILNIVVNAAHAIGDVVAGTDQKGTITIKTWRENESAVISITDTGGGIPARILDRIFDPFFTTKEVGKGTGQGLSIAHAVIHEKHGGRIAVTTDPGQGTTFTIRLPIAGPKVEVEGVAA